jgi:uncharacterized protein YpmS
MFKRDSHSGKTGVWGWLVLVVIALLCLLALVLVWMWNSEPGYWQANRQFIDSTGQEQLQQSAERLEMHFGSQLSNLPSGAEGKVSLISVPLEQINAWLAGRLDAWLAHQCTPLPAQVSEIMLSSAEGEVVVAFRLETSEIDQVISLVIATEAQADGTMHLQLASIRAGRLPVPVSFLVGQLQADPSGSNPLVEQISQMAKGVSVPLLQQLDAVRQVRLLGVQVHHDRIDLVVRAERLE